MPSRKRAFQIRDFRPTDFETLWRIDQACFSPGIAYSRAELRSYIGRRQAFTLLAQEEGERTEKVTPVKKENALAPLPQNTIGIAGFIVAETQGRVGHILTIDVVASARRFGVGSLLLRSAEKRLQASACLAVGLETAVDNTSALSFYKRHRYHVVRTFPRYYANGVDALVLEKDLAGELT